MPVLIAELPESLKGEAVSGLRNVGMSPVQLNHLDGSPTPNPYVLYWHGLQRHGPLTYSWDLGCIKGLEWVMETYHHVLEIEIVQSN